MSENKKLVPKRRFKEFENADAWEQRELDKEAEIIAGGDIDKTKIASSGKYPVIANALNGDGIVGYYDDVYRVESPAVTVTGRGDVGFAKARDYNFTPVVRLLSVKSKHDIVFLENSINRQNAMVESTGVPQLTVPQLGKYKLFFPTLEEQKQIGNFFQNLDQTIALQQRKLEKMKSMKSAYLSEMFPAEGERKPKRRFPGFTDDWEQRELGEVADIIGGGTPSTSVKEFWDGNIDWYSPVEIGDKVFVNGSQKKITDLGFQKSSAQMLPAGTVLFTSRAGIGSTAILETEACTNQGFQSIVPKENLDTYFIYSRSHELKRYGEITGAGSTFVEVSGKQMAKMPILIPDIEEQREIGNFFQNLDQTIAFQQQKLEKLQNIKKAYLNEMFI
ncbi:restriction endonuclease subunit S [Lactococcus lactis]|uniref:restriction endonuclease subunit S n=1 Tax=Lactococcus lactis TaxID=1358 RepID=UPI0022E313EF|nr:restriction endonuclease subunit S [Lactococcus lactis]